MEYRGKPYTIVRGVGPDCWKWQVHLDEKNVKAGEARTRADAMNNVIWVINEALAPKETKLTPPADRAS